MKYFMFILFSDLVVIHYDDEPCAMLVVSLSPELVVLLGLGVWPAKFRDKAVMHRGTACD